MSQPTTNRIPVEALRADANDSTVHVTSWEDAIGWDSEESEERGKFWESVRCYGTATRGQLPEGASIVGGEIDLPNGDTVPLTSTIEQLYQHLDSVHADTGDEVVEAVGNADTVEELVDAHEQAHKAAGTPVEDDLFDRTFIGDRYDCQQPTDGDGNCRNPECDRFGDDDPAGPNEGREGPMMNYWYPFDPRSDFDPVAEAAKLVDVPLCIVQVDDRYGLALTGGGMDLTWEIVEAFTLLGMLPPADHLDLPGMAGKRLDDKHAYLLAACRRTVEIQQERLSYSLSRLDRVEAGLREESERRAQ